MRLSRAESAVITAGKVRDYLLNEQHPDGRGKARFFENVGFSRSDWEVLRDALFEHAQVVEVEELRKSPFGKCLDGDGPLRTPFGVVVQIRSGWMFYEPDGPPHLITAYPSKRR